MYIKRIKISGFRSYSNCAIQNVSPGLNVIVGPNGSGKSNIICALDFVLTKNFARLDSSQREMLICQKTSSNVAPVAIVEVEFDNSDLHFPISDKQLIIRRHLSKNSDQYYINDSLSNYSVLQTILETGGFSVNNSYYLVKQGVITEVALSTPQFLLDILKGIGGANTYDDRKKGSSKLLRNTQLELENLKEQIKVTNENLQMFNIDQNLIQKYQDLDIVHKYIRSRYNQIEAVKYEEQLKEIEKKYKKTSESVGAAYADVTDIENQIDSLEKDVKNIKIKIETSKRELEVKRLLMSELTDQISKINENFNSQSFAIPDNNEFLGDIENKIESVEASLENLKREVEISRKNLFETKKLTQMGDKKRKNLILLHRLVTELDDQGVVQNIFKILAELGKDIEHYKELRKNYDKISIDLIEKIDTFAKHDSAEHSKIETRSKCLKKIETLKRDLADVSYEHKSIVAQITNEQKNIMAVEKQVREKQIELNSLTNMALEGRTSINKLMKQLRIEVKNSNETLREITRCQKLIESYHGQIIDCVQFTREDQLDHPIESLIKNRLFYHIVDDEEVANEILHEIEKRELKGNFTFLSLNRLIQNETCLREDASSDNQMFALLCTVSPVKNVDRAIKFVFGGKFVCEDFERCCEFSQTNRNCDFATIDGDMIDRNGVITTYGRGNRESRLKMFRKWSELVAFHQMSNQNLSKLETELEALNGRIKSIASQLSDAENEDITVDIDLSAHFLHEKSFEYYKKFDQLQKQKDEVGLKMACLNEERIFWKNYQKTFGLRERIKNESTENNLQILLEENSKNMIRYNSFIKENHTLEMNLNEKRNTLLQLKQQKLSMEKSNLYQSSDASMFQYEQELKKKLKEHEDICTKLSKKINDSANEMNEKIKELHQMKAVLTDENEKFEVLKKEFQKFLKMKKHFEELILKARLDCDRIDKRKIPDKYIKLEGYDEISKTYKQVTKQLNVLSREKLTRETIRTYQEMLAKREQLTLNSDSMNRLIEETESLIRIIDDQKAEIIVRTYKQVNFYFQEIFRKFVPNGSCCIQFIRAVQSQNRSQQLVEGSNLSSNNISLSSSISGFEISHQVREDFIGLEILVSFSRHVPDQELVSLSGGQKALVALSFILALQRVDPTPFYIFDEIDQSLDPTYREIVAELIAENSKTKQFFVTSFRRELVEKGDVFFGVENKGGISIVKQVEKEEALKFINEIQIPNDSAHPDKFNV